jgi:hypothetical protein
LSSRRRYTDRFSVRRYFDTLIALHSVSVHMVSFCALVSWALSLIPATWPVVFGLVLNVVGGGIGIGRSCSRVVSLTDRLCSSKRQAKDVFDALDDGKEVTPETHEGFEPFAEYAQVDSIPGTQHSPPISMVYIEDDCGDLQLKVTCPVASGGTTRGHFPRRGVVQFFENTLNDMHTRAGFFFILSGSVIQIIALWFNGPLLG